MIYKDKGRYAINQNGERYADIIAILTALESANAKAVHDTRVFLEQELAKQGAKNRRKRVEKRLERILCELGELAREEPDEFGKALCALEFRLDGLHERYTWPPNYFRYEAMKQVEHCGLTAVSSVVSFLRADEARMEELRLMD